MIITTLDLPEFSSPLLFFFHPVTGLNKGPKPLGVVST
jgi:hypothetical protein